MVDLTIPRQAVRISHPLVCSAYLKMSTNIDSREERVLVLEVSGSVADGSCGDFDPYLVALLDDLQDLRTDAEKQAGSCKRIDIRRA